MNEIIGRNEMKFTITLMDCGYFWTPYIALDDEKPTGSISEEIDKLPRKESRLDKRLKLPEDAARMAKLIGWIPKY